MAKNTDPSRCGRCGARLALHPFYVTGFRPLSYAPCAICMLDMGKKLAAKEARKRAKAGAA